MTQRDVVAIAMDLTKTAKGPVSSDMRFRCARGPSVPFCGPKLQMTAALGNRADVDDRLDRGFANAGYELFRSRGFMPEREQPRRYR